MALSLYTVMAYRTFRRAGGVRFGFARIIPAAAIMQLGVACGIIAFWTAFFLTDMVNIQDSHLKEIYLAFESAFPLADLYLTGILVFGGIGLLKRRYYGYLLSLMGGAMLIFLGILDVSFNVKQGIYRLGAEETVLNIGINVVCLGFGLFLVRIIWKNGALRGDPPV
ncbi:MAG: hypothetical protein JXB23_05145 [Candidatus Aminicenantes bacterium]|nr:hypothetical protein [Candidatus Aminicenantes bacterium]